MINVIICIGFLGSFRSAHLLSCVCFSVKKGGKMEAVYLFSLSFSIRNNYFFFSPILLREQKKIHLNLSFYNFLLKTELKKNKKKTLLLAFFFIYYSFNPMSCLSIHFVLQKKNKIFT
jgi:hypothetical protein